MEVTDAMEAADIVCNYLLDKKGIILFKNEIQSIKLHDGQWTVKVKDDLYPNNIIIDAKTGIAMSKVE